MNATNQPTNQQAADDRKATAEASKAATAAIPKAVQEQGAATVTGTAANFAAVNTAANIAAVNTAMENQWLSLEEQQVLDGLQQQYSMYGLCTGVQMTPQQQLAAAKALAMRHITAPKDIVSLLETKTLRPS